MPFPGSNLVVGQIMISMPNLGQMHCTNKKIGLLQRAITRLALEESVHGVAFDIMAKNAWVILAVEDIEDEVFWRAICIC